MRHNIFDVQCNWYTEATRLMQLTINGGYIYQFSIMQSACLKTYQSHFISQHITQYHSAPEIGLGWEAWPKV